jgi:hypothetical protein
MTASLLPDHAPTILLKSSAIEVELYADRPIVQQYRHLASNTTFHGGSRDGRLALNGDAISWDRLEVEAHHVSGHSIRYRLRLADLDAAFDMTFTLDGSALKLRMGNVHDPYSRLNSIGWTDLAMVRSADPTFRWWRYAVGPPPWPEKRVEARGLWWDRHSDHGQVGTTASDLATLYGCLYNPDHCCVFLHSSQTLFPIRVHAREKECALGLDTYHYRLLGKPQPDLEVEVVFTGDLNGDGRADDSDYRLWLNRRSPDADPLLRQSLWYKVFLDSPSTGVRTTLAQARSLIEKIHHITDGIPQICYLVGWQYHGHDTGYPSLDRVNDHIGSAEDLRALAHHAHDRCRTVLSFHANIDDAYRDSKDFDDALMARDYDGSPMFWFEYHGRVCYHLSHARDTAKGAIFKRLEAMLQTVPVSHTLQLDAMRTTNCNPNWEPDHIGVAEELELGLRPIMHWLQQHGIRVTTEGVNGMPHALAGLVDGYWHIDGDLEMRQIEHRKVVGGGTGEGRGRQECCVGTSIHQDFTYETTDWSISFRDHWDVIVSRIYLGSLLYHFYLERELLHAVEDASGMHLRYSDGVDARLTPDGAFTVTWGDVTVAQDDDRFIPRDGAIYAYSLHGCERWWVLPPDLRGKPLLAVTLTPEGRAPGPELEIDGDRVRLKLEPGTPVKIMSKDAALQGE